MITVSAQHAATFGKSIARTVNYISFAAKETVTIKKKDNMEIVSIERKTFEAMVAKFDRFVSPNGCHLPSARKKKWASGWTIRTCCRMLNISPRTLQTLRDNRTLAYSQINHKTYYRPEDVQRIVSMWRTGERKRSSKAGQSEQPNRVQQ